MLNKASIEAAVEIADMYKINNSVVIASEETPIAMLVDAGKPIEYDNVPEQDIDIVSSLESSSIEITGQNINSHDNLIANTTDQIAGVINRRLHLARTFINPLVKEYTDLLVASITNRVPTTPEVVKVEYDNFYTNPLVKDIFKGYGYTELGNLEGLKNVEFNEENDYRLGSFKTGSRLVDGVFDRIFAVYGKQWVIEQGVKYFTNGENIDVVNVTNDLDYKQAIDSNLVIHFYARALSNDETVNVDKLHILKILGRTALNINTLIDVINKLDKNETVITKHSMESNQIFVYGPNYDKYISQGGNDTALAGLVRTKKYHKSIQHIINDKTSLENIYDTEVTKELIDIRDSKFKLAQQAALTHLVTIVDKIPEQVINSIPALINGPESPKEKLINRGKEYINNPVTLDLDNIPQYALDIITFGLLPELELNAFFKEMERYLTPGNYSAPLTPKQAVYYVVLEEIVRHLLSQVSLDNLGGQK